MADHYQCIQCTFSTRVHVDSGCITVQHHWERCGVFSHLVSADALSGGRLDLRTRCGSATATCAGHSLCCTCLSVVGLKLQLWKGNQLCFTVAKDVTSLQLQHRQLSPCAYLATWSLLWETTVWPMQLLPVTCRRAGWFTAIRMEIMLPDWLCVPAAVNSCLRNMHFVLPQPSNVTWQRCVWEHTTCAHSSCPDKCKYTLSYLQAGIVYN